MENLNELSKEIYEGNKLRGFNTANENVGQTLMLVVSELSEALEAHRKNKFVDLLPEEILILKDNTLPNEDFKDVFQKLIKDTFEDEIADSFIRLFDLCGAFDIDIEKHMELKLKYNSMREYKHGKAY